MVRDKTGGDDVGAMRVVVDVQAMQTPDSRQRGIGNYVAMATRALVEAGDDHWLTLTSNRAFPRPDIVVPDAVAWAEYHAIADRPWGASTSVRECADEFVRQCWISRNPDVVHVGSVFEGYSSGAPVPSLPRPVADGLPVRTAFLYDLIPLRFRDHYLRDQTFAEWYLHRCDALKSFDLLFAISEATRRDAMELLGIPGRKIVNVGGSCHPRYRRLGADEIDRSGLRAAYGISQDFILSVSGDEYRKNIPRLVEAYASMSDDIRNAHELVVVCRLSDATREALDQLLARYPQSVAERVKFLGFVEDDDLVRLYNDCSLFVFPSFYEGLGIPVIEALRCGATAIAGANSSLLELIPDSDRQFDALDFRSIAKCMQRQLVRAPVTEADRAANVARADRHSWSAVARHMVSEWELLVSERRLTSAERMLRAKPVKERPRLAMFTPLPSVASGIADYSFEFIPHLSKHFAIDVFLGERDVAMDRLPAGVDHVEWLEPGGFEPDEYFATLYEMGNSEFHGHLLRLMVDKPGIVTLHDAFLSGLVYWASENAPNLVQGSFADVGLASHGGAFRRALDCGSEFVERAILDWPLTAPVFERSLGVISHTPFNVAIANRLLGHRVASPYRVIAHARDLPGVVTEDQRREAKLELGFASDSIVVTTFGHVSWHKLGDVLVEAYARSKFGSDGNAFLVFAGGIAEPHFGEVLTGLVDAYGLAAQIRVTGFLERSDYEKHLAATDLAVQLRTETRGGTSGATLDVVARAIPTIANDYGSFADYPSDSISFVPSRPTPDDLAAVLNRFPHPDILVGAQRGRDFVANRHDPVRCAASYAQFIHECVERSDHKAPRAVGRRVGRNLAALPPDEREALVDECARELSRQAGRVPTRQLLLDVSRTYFERRSHRTGIQRVVREVSREVLRSARANLDGRLIAFESTDVVTDLADFQDELGVLLPGESGVFRSGARGPQDTLLLLDFDLGVFDRCDIQIDVWRKSGGRLVTVVYDLIPLRYPQFVPEGSSASFQVWLDAALRVSDGVVCISKAVADDLLEYIRSEGADVGQGLDVGYWRLGTPRLPVIDQIQRAGRPTGPDLAFLMVSTVEPRKGHAVVLDAFERLWLEGAAHRLRIVGNEGWSSDSLARRIRTHPEIGRRLEWLTDADDAELAAEYRDSDAVIVASEAEGFGLPIAEALSYGRPVIARDLKVFDDFSGPGLHRFTFASGADLAECLRVWLESARSDPEVLSPAARSGITWEESVEHLLRVAIDGAWYRRL